jgi:hypothetical protein
MEDKRFLMFCLLMLEEAFDQLADLEQAQPQIVFLSIAKRVLERLNPMTDEQVKQWLSQHDFNTESAE